MSERFHCQVLASCVEDELKRVGEEHTDGSQYPLVQDLVLAERLSECLHCSILARCLSYLREKSQLQYRKACGEGDLVASKASLANVES